MRKLSWVAVYAVAIFSVVAGGWSAPASATPTADCREVSVNLVDRRDNGSDGNQWAKDTMTRTLKVCVEAAAPADAKAAEARVLYRATVVDNGTFVTVAGTSPRAGVPLAKGITGTIKGGFRVAVFTAPMWTADYKLTAPGQTTPSGEWLKTAMPTAEAEPAMTVYNWSYKTDCESYVDNNGAYAGDITSKCVTAKAPTVTAPTCDKGGEVVVPQVVGVRYVVGTKVNGKVVVTAKAKPGYLLVGEDKWTLTPLPAKDCSSPSPTPTPSQSGSATPTPSSTTTGAPTASASASVVPGAVGGGGTGSGGLPVTGARVLAVAGIGGLLIAAGGLMLVWLKRRGEDAADIT